MTRSSPHHNVLLFEHTDLAFQMLLPHLLPANEAALPNDNILRHIPGRDPEVSSCFRKLAGFHLGYSVSLRVQAKQSSWAHKSEEPDPSSGAYASLSWA